ncbi:MAG: gluconate 2-dehydrogenase subunit 3 family protein [bacterium]|nr:gluconate 2-dehydrogenase subunit 3 family protein [bacterium]
MSRLRLPPLGCVAPPPLPPPPTPTQAVRILLTRRQFLGAAGAALVVAASPWTRVEQAWAARRGRFFTKAERRTLDALVDTILPPDADPGAGALGVVRYLDRYLTALDFRTPLLYAGGPFSGRRPFIDYATGRPAKKRPKNAFATFVPPTRLQALHWRWELLGSAGLDADERALVAPLDAQRGGPLRGLRDVYRDGLAQLDALARIEAGTAFAKLDAETQAAIRDLARTRFPVDARRGRGFVDLVVQHTIEGCFAAPEYGGNRKTRGWALLGVEGDSQPLGYALYSRATDAYAERPEQPLTTPNPDEIAAPKPISAEAESIQTFIAATGDALERACS